jgi:hypothetical protein
MGIVMALAERSKPKDKQMSEEKAVVYRRAYNHVYEVYAGWDESERTKEHGNRIYVSSKPRRVWLCKRYNESGEVDGELFDRKKDAVVWGEKWLDAAK